MKTFCTIFSLLLVVLFSTVAFSQTVDLEIASPAKPHKFSATVSYGLSYSGTGNDLLQGMENSGLNDRSEVYFLFWVGKAYPIIKQTISYLNFQARYDLTYKSGIAISWNTAMNATVTGLERQVNDSNFLTLDSKLKVLTVEYIVRTGKGWSGLSVGPALAFHKLYQQQRNPEVTPYQHKAIKPGIHLGYNLSIIKSSTWIVAANVQYNWFLKDKVGPITIEDEITSVFKTQPVGLSNLGLGITTGFKF